MGDVFESRFHHGWDVPAPEPTGVLSLQIEFELTVMSMSVRGFDAMPDDTMIDFWLADNFEGSPDDEAPAEPRALQAMMDGPMVGSGIGSK